MVKMMANPVWETSHGIDIDAWLQHLSQGAYAAHVPLLRHVSELTQLAGTNHPTEFGLDCVQLGFMMAIGLSELNVDHETLIAAMLSPAVQYADLSLDDVAEQLGQPIAHLVSGVLKMSGLSTLREANTDHQSKHQVDNVRKMLLAMVEDVRVVLIKLIERLCVLREMEQLPPFMRRKMASEVRDVYAPLAHRLGMSALKWEMEDLAFRYLEPALYQQIAKGLNQTRIAREQYVQRVEQQLTMALEKENIHDAVVYGRAKHIDSIARKMKRKNLELSEVYDAFAFRVLVKTESDCYRVLSLVHTLWQPVFSEYDDYISQPKPNGYRSLHTVVRGPDGYTFEIQIRTKEMHRLAETGEAAHWKYKEGVGKAKFSYERKIAWLREVLSWRREMASAAGACDLEYEGEDERIYVFTPTGEVLDMPQGSTPLDFAYSVHTQLGHRCRGVKVNDQMVPFHYVLQTGDRVEVLAGKEDKPSRDWLNPHIGYVTTARAKAKILHWFKEKDAVTHQDLGYEILERELKAHHLKMESLQAVKVQLHYKTLEELYVAVGRGELRIGRVLQRLLPLQASLEDLPETPHLPVPMRAAPTQELLKIDGVGRLLTNLAKCCHPSVGDAIVGYVTVSRGISIHQKSCANIARATEKQRERFIEVSWG